MRFLCLWLSVFAFVDNVGVTWFFFCGFLTICLREGEKLGVCCNAVDDSEIRRSPVTRSLIPVFTGLCASQVVQDFFNQQY